MLEDDRRITQMSYQNNGDLLASGTKDGPSFFGILQHPEKPRLVFEVDAAINHLSNGLKMENFLSYEKVKDDKEQ